MTTGEQKRVNDIRQTAILYSKEKEAFRDWVDHAKQEADKVETVKFRVVCGDVVEHPVGVVYDWFRLPATDEVDALSYFEVLYHRILSLLIERTEHLVANWQHERLLSSLASQWTCEMFDGTKNEDGERLSYYEGLASAANAVAKCGASS